MGSILSYEASSGRRYRVMYRTPDHRQTTKRGFKTKREAELYLATVETNKARGEYIDASAARVTIASLGTEWLANQTHLKPSSLRPLEIAWRLQVEPRWGKVPVGDVRHSDVQTWVTSLSAGKSATTVLRAFGVLAGILDVAVKDRRVTVNVARGSRLPRKVARAHRYLSHQQVHDLAIASGKHQVLVLLLAYTGLRWGEVIALRVRDVDFTRRRLAISENAVEVGPETIVGTPKNHKRRSVPFPSFLGDAIEEAAKGKEPSALLTWRTGARPSPGLSGERRRPHSANRAVETGRTAARCRLHGATPSEEHPAACGHEFLQPRVHNLPCMEVATAKDRVRAETARQMARWLSAI